MYCQTRTVNYTHRADLVSCRNLSQERPEGYITYWCTVCYREMRLLVHPQPIAMSRQRLLQTFKLRGLLSLATGDNTTWVDKRLEI